MVAYFDNRTAEIIETVPADWLFVCQIKAGWGPLCEFLDVSVPDMDFPRINSRDETKELIAKMTAASGKQISDEAMAAAGRQLHRAER